MSPGQIVAIGFLILMAALIIRQQRSIRALLASDKLVLLDAEKLARRGMGEAYQKLLPRLKQYVTEPEQLDDVVDPDRESYAIRCNGQEHQICSGDDTETEHEIWARATYYFFKTVNDQLAESEVRFYALHGGNDLAGVFLTPNQEKIVSAAMAHKSDGPYFPELDGPWYGQPH